jgi:hypothetical protein
VNRLAIWVLSVLFAALAADCNVAGVLGNKISQRNRRAGRLPQNHATPSKSLLA